MKRSWSKIRRYFKKIGPHLWVLWLFLGIVLGGPVAIFLTAKVWFYFNSDELAQWDRNFVQDYSEVENLRSGFIMKNGGEAQLAALQSLRSVGFLEHGGQRVGFFSIKKKDGQSVTTLRYPDYEISYGVGKENAWMRLRADGRDPKWELKEGPEAVEIRKMGALFEPVVRVLAFEQGTVKSLSLETWEDIPAARVEFETDDAIPIRATAYIDIEAMQTLVHSEQLPDGSELKKVYSNYQSVGGIQHPFMIQVLVDGEEDSRIVFERIDQNVGTLSDFFRFRG